MNATNIRQLLPFPKFQFNVVFILGVILVAALLAFEVFNYGTTEYALTDLLGGLSFLGLKWSTILTIAFCGIDFAGISRLFLVGKENQEASEGWYLFGAWFLSGTMNAILTWWGVSMAVINHPVQSSSILDAGTITKIIPIFVAMMVWVIRIMAIGTVATAGSNIFRTPVRSLSSNGSFRRKLEPGERPSNNFLRPVSQPLAARMGPVVRPTQGLTRREISEPSREPTYQRVA
jgi:hypothetical protein